MEKQNKNSEERKGMGDLTNSFMNLALAQSALGFVSPELFNNKDYNRYKDKKYKKFNELKGGNNIMETKSRYEVIAELEEKKRDLILSRDSLNDNLKNKQKELKMLNRDVEDKQEEIKEFEDSMKDQKETIEELIKSVDENLNRFTELSNKKSQSQKK